MAETLSDFGESEAAVNSPLNAAEPSRETPASGRDAAGRFVAGAPGPRLTTGEYSVLVRSGAATGRQASVAALRAQVRDEVGAGGAIKRSMADAFVELDCVRAYLGTRLEREGPLTGKGRTRALMSAYLSVIDRQVRLAQLLGLEPRERYVDPLVAVERAVREANSDQEEETDGD